MKTTPLYLNHIGLRAHMGEFAGYGMPLYYADGVMKEHEWVRSHAGVFDVSHMGQMIFQGRGAANFLERLTPSSFTNAKPFVAKYTVLTNELGGIVDDLIVTKLAEDKFFVVVNAGCKEKDIAWFVRHMPDDVEVHIWDKRALVALQGPEAEKVMREALDIDTSSLGYMRLMEWGDCMISRLGYTGEDGFELSVPAAHADTLWHKLIAHSSVKPIGLAARDFLRLEMGYCLYGHDITDETSPLEADLSWVVSKTNTGFIGAENIAEPRHKRVGFKLIDKGIAREGAKVRTMRDEVIGKVTSGGFSPSLKQSIGQAYVPIDYAKEGTQILVHVRGNNILGEVTAMPFLQSKVKK